MSEQLKVLCHACGERAEVEGEGAAETASCEACGEGLLLQRRYLLERVLGSNVGTTYLARDVGAGSASKVVIKELLYSKLDAWKSEDLFQREIRVLRQLDHPLIPNYLDDFSLGEGKRLRHYLVQQHLEGLSLAEEQDERRYDEQQLLELLDGVLQVLEYLQQLRPPLIHRDLKPSNLMRLRDGSVAVIDFGAVRDLVAPSGDNPTVAGTFGYMAPEQFQGDAYLQTDIYALGVVALALLSRRRPEKMLGSSMRLEWREHVKVSAPMEQLLAALTAPEVDARPEDAKAARALVARTRKQLLEPQRAVKATKPREGSSPRAELKQLRARNKRMLRVVLPLAALAGLAVIFGSGYAMKAGVGCIRGNRGPTVRKVATTSPRAKARRARASRPRRSSTRAPTASVKMAIDLDVASLVKELTAHRWRGTLNGELRFEGTAEMLRAWLVRRDGSKTPLLARPGPAGTISLVLRQRSGGVTTVHTFSGGMTADRRRLKGSFEKVERSGGQRYESSGHWQVSAVIVERGR
jgi:serine/threonine protein kinase